jgi:hypothetical protein
MQHFRSHAWRRRLAARGGSAFVAVLNPMRQRRESRRRERVQNGEGKNGGRNRIERLELDARRKLLRKRLIRR